ncbi:coagulation factor 5/8 type domain-containing protein [Streptomyces sp. NPDC058457]|uniref:coagulation factor 5/8 type domain-containing protein n=1 Tax=Streptomyces sp. NPDC058457 TaxID=3346507 RepID=UPI00365F17F4
MFFEPGTYGSAAGADDPATATGIVNAQVGYYTSIAGLGSSPKDVVINGALHVEPQTAPRVGDIALTNFWRSLGDLTINPIQRPVGSDAASARPQGLEDPHTMRWAVSQATPLRRVNIEGNLDLNGRYGAFGFGSYLADSRVGGTVISGDGLTGRAQAQWYTRDSRIGGWNGTGVNLVFSGVQGAPAGDFDPAGTTTLSRTPLSRQAPFLFLDHNRYTVFAPYARTATAGANWSTAQNAGRRIPIDRFYIARPTDTAETINRALASGRNLLLTPGVYSLDAPIRVSRPNTVVMGLGYATLTPTSGTAALEIGDVDGVVVSGVTVDAGPVRSNVLVRVGTPGGHGRHGGHSGHAADPTTFHDLSVRVGGPRPGLATTSVEVNSDHVLLDNTWLWRGQVGNTNGAQGVGWTVNPADHGLVVNGDDVTALGLSVEHYQKEQVVWNGERGRTVFYQSELPEDMPSQAAWRDGATQGYSAYVVADDVKKHEATGMAIYSLFPFPPTEAVHASTAIQAPVRTRVRFQSIAIGVVLGQGGIRHIINDAGAGVDATQPNNAQAGMTALTRMPSYPPR